MTDEDQDRLEAACQPGVWGYDPQLARQILFLIGEVRGWRQFMRNAAPKRHRVGGRLDHAEDALP